MIKENSKKRPYDSKRRREQADQTRRLIIEAARKLFIKFGYWGTSIDSIAESAGVAPETIYATFGSKREVLHQLIDISIGGDEKRVRLLDRPEQQAVLQETDARRMITGFSEGVSQILSRAAPLMSVLAEAAKNEPELDRLQTRLRSERLENMRMVAHSVAKLTPLRVTESEAANTIWALSSPELFLLLIGSGKWTEAQYATWLRESLFRLLFQD